MVDETEVQQRLHELADQMTHCGALRNPQWRQAFITVQRHLFVPHYLHDDEPGAFPARWRVVNGAKTEDHDEWINAVYSDRTLITDLRPIPIPAEHGGGAHPIVTSSSTMPSLMIRMLEDLDVATGMRVLEIGTGTGYHAALLCERLGDHNVTSIDIDPNLVELAREQLSAHGYHPHLVAGDGEHGVPDPAPYDRVIATCGVDHIPLAWVEQTRPGGVILANLRARLMPSALVRLVVNDDGTASGPFLNTRGSFMALRRDPTAPFDYSITQRRGDSPATTRVTALDPATLHDDQRWGFFAELCLPGTAIFTHSTDGGAPFTEIRAADGSWATVLHAPVQCRFPVTQAGPRRLWDNVETIHDRWTNYGKPSWESLGLTVGQRRQHAWVGDPANVLAGSSRCIP